MIDLSVLKLSDWLLIICIVLMIILIFIMLAVLKALKNTTPKATQEKISEAAGNVSDTISGILKTLNLDKVKDVISLVKDLITDNPAVMGENNGDNNRKD